MPPKPPPKPKVVVPAGKEEAWVSALYELALGREADEAGLAHHVALVKKAKGDPRAVAGGIVGSAERKQNDVAELYSRVLGREPDAAGLAYWVASKLTALQAEAEFFCTQEFMEGLADEPPPPPPEPEAN